MPLYEYECPDTECTGHEGFEAVCSVAERGTVECPYCHGTGKQVLRSAPGIALLSMEPGRLKEALEKRSEEHGRRTYKESIDRIESGDMSGRGNIYNPKVQKEILRKKGVKVD